MNQRETTHPQPNDNSAALQYITLLNRYNTE
jgi:hypothetical protein